MGREETKLLSQVGLLMYLNKVSLKNRLVLKYRLAVDTSGYSFQE